MMTRLSKPHRASQRRTARLVWQCFCGLMAGLALVGPASTYAQDTATAAPDLTAINPLILFENDRLVKCGLRAAFGTGDTGYSADIVLHRMGDTAQWVVEVIGPTLTAGGPSPHDLGVKTASHDTRKNFSKPVSLASGSFEVRGSLEGLEGSTFIQEIMVQGATIGVTPAAGDSVQLILSGPLPQPVRASYLMCAGDLFRP